MFRDAAEELMESTPWWVGDRRTEERRRRLLEEIRRREQGAAEQRQRQCRGGPGGAEEAPRQAGRQARLDGFEFYHPRGAVKLLLYGARERLLLERAKHG